MDITLRPYQDKIIEDTRLLMRKGHKSILIIAPTGSGKTILTAFMLKSAAEKGMRSWFILHRRELVYQTMEAFEGVGLPYGVIANGFPANLANTQIASIQTLVRRYKGYPSPDFIIFDECHHIAASSWNNIYNSNTQAYKVGLTATPLRLDGKGLGKYFEELIVGPSVTELTLQGFLSPYKMFAPSTVDVSGVHTRMGDYDKAELSHVMDRPTVTGNAIREYKKLCNGKRALVFAVSVIHSKHVAEQFNFEGISSKHIDGKTPVQERDTAIRQFRRGDIKVLCNVGLVGEGFDLPAIESVILLRPTKSLGLYLQQVGRSLRPYPGKGEAIILDHAGNCLVHGLPDDDREWSLEGKKKRQQLGISAPPVKRCMQCFAVQRPGRSHCMYCGAMFEVKERKIAFVEGDLEQVDPKLLKLKRMREQSSAQTLYELIELGRSRGYRRPDLWGAHILKARQKKRRY